MDRWESTARKKLGRGESQKGEEKRWRKSEERRCRCAKRKGSRETLCFFQWCVAPEDRKVRSLKRQVRSHLARWKIKNCAPLWRKAHLQVKMYKAPQLWSTLGSWDVEKVHAGVARSTFGSKTCQKLRVFCLFWCVRCRFVERWMDMEKLVG